MQIHTPNDTFDFSKINASPPLSIGGGNFFIKMKMNENPIYIEPPKCRTKQGVYKSGKHNYCELVFSNEDEHFIHWIENLETFCKKKLFEKRNAWFETNLEEDDIEVSFTPPLKMKSVKNYVLKTNVPPALKLYGIHKTEINIDSINDKTELISILEIQGIKCSPRNFQLEMEIKQLMVVNSSSNPFGTCVLTEPAISHVPTSASSASTSQSASPPAMEEIFEIDINLEKIMPDTSIQLKKRNQIYYEMYKEARRRAKIARDLAISSYLEAKNIKSLHLLNDIVDTDSDDDEKI